ncbi:hypothetical protein [Mycobacterium intracellulare]|uniref:Uncharacterized protein n=1 Tax=Mycobacterium intracellulare subsp. chimaera TaxID=222805 RepID=A0ABT7NZF5_MYCIT|nr:hypothetical protein [Mycobacterium intracellulare]MCF1812009.1 hypothetical protein [Mycobacterium intracellulare subsp. intracellulare]MDM3926397.1 hypothetical protein [Mycobacterium intracellulare subsp. chimaera]MDS0333522.1 hypothetical protein [Mycobacterium intracellulare]
MTILEDGWTKIASRQTEAAALQKARMNFYLRPAAMEVEGDCTQPRFFRRPPQSSTDNAQVRAHTTLTALLADRCINAGMASRGRQLIEFLFKTHTVDASIAPEDDGLIFYWAARDMAITIQIFSSGDYWWSVRNIAGMSFSDSGSNLPLRELRYSLNQFSKEVERQNPNWRNIVR